FFLTHGFRGYARLLFGSRDAVAHDILECRYSFMLDDVECVGEFPIANGSAGFEQAFERQKKMPRALDGVGFALQPDPAFAGSRFDAELLFERLQIAGIVIVKLLGDACAFEMESLSGHSKLSI